MYTVEKIINNIVKLEDRDAEKYIEINKKELPSDIKEGDILIIKSGKFIINKTITKEKKKNIRNKFNSLIN